MIKTCFTDIAGTDFSSLLDNFSKVIKENKKYKKISYNIWRQLVSYSFNSKVKLKVKTDGSNVIYFEIGILSLKPKENDFALYLEDCLNSIIKDKVFEKFEWHDENKNKKISSDSDGISISFNEGEINAEINDILNSIDGIKTLYTPAITTTANVYTINTSPYDSYIGTLHNDDVITKEEYQQMLSWQEKMTDVLKDLGVVVFDSDGNLVVTDKNKEEKDPMVTFHNGKNLIIDNKEEKNSMNTNNIFDFDFGVVPEDQKIRMSMYGYAIPNEAGKYVSYDAKNNCMMDVQILNFNCTGMFYKIPKPLSKINVSDVIFHNGIPMFVREISEDKKRLTVIDPREGTEKSILPAYSPFGFDYITTLVSLMDSFDNEPANKDNPFGKMLPFVLMNNGQTADQTLPLLFMMNGKMDMDNPMMLLALSGNNNLNINNPLMLMAMMKMFDK